MKNAYEVLREKELELSKVETEVEALRMVAPLLSNDNEASDNEKAATAGSTVQLRPDWMPRAVNSSSQLADASQREAKAKNWP